jgi:hypothetical protein
MSLKCHRLSSVMMNREVMECVRERARHECTNTQCQYLIVMTLDALFLAHAIATSKLHTVGRR